MKKLQIMTLVLLATMICACGNAGQTGDKAAAPKADKTAEQSESQNESVFDIKFMDKDEAVSCFLSNEEYFDGFSECDIQYKTQNKNGTIEDVKEFGAAQMAEFNKEEQEGIRKIFEEMEADLDKNGYSIPETGEIQLIKSTQEEEGGSAAYTHGNHIYIGQDLTDYICSDNEEERQFGKTIMWHEVFHCLTRNNPDFRKDMYSIIHFTVQDQDYEIPPSVQEKFISNPDVERHNSYASFEIDGKKIDCFTALIATKPYEKEGDTFFDCMETALVPVDGSDKYYTSEDADNFWEIFGKNTEYVIDPEECMADNFSYAMADGMDGQDYENPEIIKAVIEYCSEDETNL